MNSTKTKVYSPISQEKIQEAMNDLERDRLEYLDLVPIVTHDIFFVVYSEQKKTTPPETDIKMYSNAPEADSYPQYSIEPEDSSIMGKIKEYKIFVGLAAIALGYYFFWMN